MKKIIIIPAYEPDDNLIRLVKDIDKEFLIVVVNDGSGSQYDNIFNSLDNRVKLLGYENNMGKGYALKTGFKYVKDNYKDYVVITMDSDGQHKISDAKKLCDYVMDNPNTLVLGMRKRGDNTPIRSRIGNEITKAIYRVTTGVNVYDTQTGLRAFSSELMDFMIGIDGDRFEYEMNVLLECARDNIKIHEIEIETIYIKNNSGSHFDSIKDSYRIYKEIFKFSLSSICSFILDYLLYSVFIIIFNSLILSNVMARVISASFNYIVNKKIVFKSKKCGYKSLLSYIGLAILILVLNTFILNLLVYKLFINKYLAKIIVELLLFIFSWSIQRKFIFSDYVINEKDY